MDTCLVHMDSKLMVGTEFGNIDNRLFACVSSNNMERALQRPLIYRTFQELSSVSAAPCQYFQTEDADITESDISESGWTTYFDDCVDSWSDKYTASQFDIEQQQRKRSNFTEDIYDYWASSITGNEESSSLASDASSGPQKLPLPVQDIEFEHGRQSSGSYSSYSLVAIRKRDVHVDKGEDSASIGSCSLQDIAPRNYKFRRLNTDEHNDPFLEDTATSPIHTLEADALTTR